MIDILIPTLGRADRLEAIARNIAEATINEHTVWFCIEAEDEASRQAVLDARIAVSDNIGMAYNDRSRSYAGAINTAYHAVRLGRRSEYLFCGADDLHFEQGWDAWALALFDGWAGVVGTNDLLNPYVLQGMHSTHSLVARWYLDDIGGVVDEGPGSFLHEGYGHNYVDTELIATAKARARFRPCLASVVRHLHQSAGFTPHDATHDKAEATYGADAELYDTRRPLWQNLSR